MSIVDVMDMEYKGFEGSIKKIEYPRELIEDFNKEYKDMSLRSWWYCGYIHVPATIDFVKGIIEKAIDYLDNIDEGDLHD